MVCVFDKWTKQDKFHTCGTRVLNPTKCMIHQEENGDYSLELHQPILPDDDCYQFLTPYNVIKVTSGQLFPIEYIQKKMVSGVPTVIVKAKHIFYYLNHKYTFNIQTQGENGWSCWSVIDQLFDNARIIKTKDLVEYEFSHNSNLAEWNHYNANGITIAKGVFDCCDIWKGYLYRDNFYFSVRDVMEGAKSNAFIAEHGWNVSDITETIDYSDTYTELLADDNKGTPQYQVSIQPAYGGRFPYQITGYTQFSYDEHSNLWNDGAKYFGDHKDPSCAYDINLLNLSDTSRAAGWDGFERVRVGDVGTVRSEILGISTNQRVVSTDFNELTQRNESVRIQGFRRSGSLHPDRFSQFTSGNNAETKRLAALERKGSYFTLVE